ncbi:hypothetical protein KVK26_00865 [Helicobacter pylori]|nr:hypothetical protein KVK26_00865 [Helicobacter pylori]
MFVADVVIISIVLIGVSYILFGKKKNVKEDSKFHKIVVKIVGIIIAVSICCPWIWAILFFISM